MQTKHHLNEQLLMGYAAGILPEAFNLVVATHLSLSDESRAMLGCYESLGGCVLDSCDGVPLKDSCFEATLKRIRQTKREKPDTTDDSCIFPKPLRTYVGGDVDVVKWKSLGLGVKQAILPTSKDASARLLFIPAGQSVPDHGHKGTELTLVLQGAFADEVDHFGPGDIEIANEDLEHQPIADQGQDCICLAATDAPLRFSSLLPRLMQPFFKI